MAAEAKETSEATTSASSRDDNANPINPNPIERGTEGAWSGSGGEEERESGQLVWGAHVERDHSDSGDGRDEHAREAREDEDWTNDHEREQKTADSPFGGKEGVEGGVDQGVKKNAAAMKGGGSGGGGGGAEGGVGVGASSKRGQQRRGAQDAMKTTGKGGEGWGRGGAGGVGGAGGQRGLTSKWVPKETKGIPTNEQISTDMTSVRAAENTTDQQPSSEEDVNSPTIDQTGIESPFLPAIVSASRKYTSSQMQQMATKSLPEGSHFQAYADGHGGSLEHYKRVIKRLEQKLRTEKDIHQQTCERERDTVNRLNRKIMNLEAAIEERDHEKRHRRGGQKREEKRRTEVGGEEDEREQEKTVMRRCRGGGEEEERVKRRGGGEDEEEEQDE
ncbi:hypothetical protein CBR_g4377 [Chara braunii]|uniref:Uncharacterized protein n=1 Tax=Chara braunii TaxID=69332 RepID=A0A388KHL9_CHABU|nr:hypothetical protein CBR_g4377 [Chara braunii]|eukprot:GBG69542.1 hypothetical protein CBR_g4377 [Chara braunii]